MCVWMLQGLSASWGETCVYVRQNWYASCWSEAGLCVSWPLVSVPDTAAAGVFNLELWARNNVCPKTRWWQEDQGSVSWRDPRWQLKQNRGSQPKGLVGVLGQQVSASSPNLASVCMCTSKLLSWTSQLRLVQVHADARSMLGCPGGLANVECMRASVWVHRKPFLPLCVCKLSIKWDSLLDTVKI